LQKSFVKGEAPTADNVTFEELFDLNDIQRLQDEFAEATGVASIITRTDGTPITKPSRFCRLCSDVIRATEAGRANCFGSDAQIGRLCKGGPTIQPCLSGGLWDAGAGITVGGRHIANWLIGQVRDGTQSEEAVRAYARRIGADEAAAAAAFLEVPAMSRERFGLIAQALFTLASQLSDLAYKNVQQARFIEESRKAQARILFQAQVLSNVGEAVVVTDLDGRILYWGCGAERLYGYSSAEVLGRPYRDYAGAVDTIDAAAFKREILEKGGWHGENLQRRKDGTTFWSDVHISILRDAEQRPIGFIGIDHDITEKKQAEAEREALRERTVEAQKMETVGRLAGGVAHDFNNLLMAIMGYTNLSLEALPPDHPCVANLKVVSDAAERAAALTRQLLFFARKQVIAPVVLNMNDAISGTLDMLRRLIGENIELLWMPSDNLWPVVLDKGQLDQILTNLCINARDAITNQGRIVIATENVSVVAASRPGCVGDATEEYVVLSVSDNGVGMEQSTIEHIFEPFFTTKSFGKGTGLGLATVHGIVSQNNGWVSVQSEPWKGTTFRIHLPRAHAVAHAAPPPDEAYASGGSETVLLAEDDGPVRNAVSRFLSSLGYRVLATSSAREALQEAERFDGNIHLLVTDMVMPGQNGCELFQQLRKDRPALKCLVVSGHAADALAPNGLADGTAFLAKPFTRGVLARTVRNLLDAQ